MILLTKPILAAVAAGFVLMGGAVVHYKLQSDGALDRLEKQVAQTSTWKLNAEDMKEAVDKQNRALEDMAREQALKRAQDAAELARAKAATKEAQKRAQSLATREKPAGVPACTAASRLFDEVLHGAK